MPDSEPQKLSNGPVRTLPTHETLRIYRPSDIALDVKKVFPTNFVDWKHTASDQGFLRIRPECKLGIVGLYGSLAVGDPPSPEDVEAWEASKPKDCWSYHSLFDFISVPVERDEGGLDVVIFHSQDSFQEKPLEVAHRIHLPKAASELFVMERSDYPDFDELDEDGQLEWHWNRLRIAIHERFGSAELQQQRWTIAGKIYDVTFPDE